MKTARGRLLAVGGALCAGAIILTGLAPYFHYGAPLSARPTSAFIGLLISAGVVYMALLRVIPNCKPKAGLLALCIGLGLFMRIVQFAGPPVYENDFYRYLWDGAVTAHGLDPYAVAPAGLSQREIPEHAGELIDLAEQSGEVFRRIAYPQLTTIYPPLAQAAFAAAHSLAPFSLNAWRGVLLVCECVTLVLLLALLRAGAQNPLWSLLYWWNPLIISEIANSAHMDALLAPLLLAAFWAITRHRRTLAAAALAGAAAVKLWPLLLAPGLVKRGVGWRKTLACLGVFAIVALVLLWPQLRHLQDTGAGLVAYAQGWQRNAFAFAWLARGLGVILPPTWDAAVIARALVAAVVSILALVVLTRDTNGLSAQARRWCTVIAALFLLGPTGYPWYFTWFLPLLCLWRNPVLLALTISLPLYYTRFALAGADRYDVFRTGVTAVEFLPIWLGLGWVAWQQLRSRLRPAAHAA